MNWIAPLTSKQRKPRTILNEWQKSNGTRGGLEQVNERERSVREEQIGAEKRTLNRVQLFAMVDAVERIPPWAVCIAQTDSRRALRT